MPAAQSGPACMPRRESSQSEASGPPLCHPAIKHVEPRLVVRGWLATLQHAVGCTNHHSGNPRLGPASSSHRNVAGLENQAVHGPSPVECRDLSGQLLALLDKVKARDPKSKTQSLWAATRSMRHEKAKGKLQKRLDDCQLRLDRYFGALSRFGSCSLSMQCFRADSPNRSEIRDQLAQLIKANEDNNTSLAPLLVHIQELRTGAELESIGPRARQQLQEILGISQSLYSMAAQRKFLGALAFSEMRDRIDTVEKAHEQTFKWIFEDTDHDALKSNRATQEEILQRKLEELTFDLLDLNLTSVLLTCRDAREQTGSFVRWLSSGTGVFHIAGKPGSGKSTLMKYLTSHTRVREELQKWADMSPTKFDSLCCEIS